MNSSLEGCLRTTTANVQICKSRWNSSKSIYSQFHTSKKRVIDLNVSQLLCPKLPPFHSHPSHSISKSVSYWLGKIIVVSVWWSWGPCLQYNLLYLEYHHWMSDTCSCTSPVSEMHCGWQNLQTGRGYPVHTYQKNENTQLSCKFSKHLASLDCHPTQRFTFSEII